ncbi:MAG: hypothetical protein ACKOXO_08705 [Cyanobium sp.]
MTDSALPEPLEALPIPEDAIWVEPGRLAALPTSAGAGGGRRDPAGPAAAERRARLLVIAALQQELAERGLGLSLGPELAFGNPERLLQLNRVPLQLVCGGWLEDPFAVAVRAWREASRAPLLLVAARVEEESGLVRIAAVLTAAEWLQAAQDAAVATAESLPVAAAARAEAGPRVGLLPDLASSPPNDLAAIEPALLLPLKQLRGDLERLLLLVQLCAATLPQLALPPVLLRRAGLEVDPARPGEAVVRVLDWLQGQLDPALEALGALVEPRLAPGFRRASPASMPIASDAESSDAQSSEQALAVLAIPLGLDPAGQLCSGAEAAGYLERFRLLLIPTGSQQPEGLLLRLEPELPGDLLPDGLTLEAEQGRIRQSLVSQGSGRLDLRFPASEALIQASLSSPGSEPLVLPTLQLPR